MRFAVEAWSKNEYFYVMRVTRVICVFTADHEWLNNWFDVVGI